MTPAPQHKVGMRFAASDAQLLDFLADRVAGGEIPGGDPTVFRNAATAARTGEPLIVVCRAIDEAIVMAQMFATLGCNPPTLDALPRWAKAR